MSEIDELIAQLGDLDVTDPHRGDAGDLKVRASVARDVTGRRAGPRGFARRRQTRIRAPRRPVSRLAAVAVIAAVAAGIVVASGATGGAGHGPRFTFSGGHGPQVGGARSEDAAYIVKRVKASVAADAQAGTAVHYAIYHGGSMNAAGSLVDAGWKSDAGDEYAAPDGTDYAHDTSYYMDGRIELQRSDVWTPNSGSDTYSDVETTISPAAREYSRREYGGNSGSPFAGSTNGIFSSPAQVQQALQSGTVTQQGTANIDGTPAIALALRQPNAPGNPTTEIALYVDAHTYQPLRMASYQDGFPVITVEDWESTSASAIAAAQNDAVPAGYRRVSPAAVDASTDAG